MAAIGLAITFGVMRVINMAHGEFIMMGAYTGYVVFIPAGEYRLESSLYVEHCVGFSMFGYALEIKHQISTRGSPPALSMPSYLHALLVLPARGHQQSSSGTGQSMARCS